MQIQEAHASGEDGLRSLIVESDGQIVGAGFWNNNGQPNKYSFHLVRWDADGGCTEPFDGNCGISQFWSAEKDVAKQVLIDANGNYVVAGYAGTNPNNTSGDHDFAILRWDTNGDLDTDFSSDGKRFVTFENSRNDYGTSAALQSDGKIVLAGYSKNASGNWDIAIARLNTDGTLDTDFATDGKVTTDVNGGDVIQGMAIQSDGKIVVVGTVNYGDTSSDFLIARYTTAGALDASFDSDGVQTVNISGEDRGLSVKLQTDGKIVAVGMSGHGVARDFALVRLNTNGSLDTSFDSDGIVTTDFGSTTDAARDLVIESDGKIVAVGQMHDGNDDDFAVARYMTTGALDTSFSGDGKATTDVGGNQHDDIAYAAAIASNGSIIVGGEQTQNSDSDWALVQYVSACTYSLNPTSVSAVAAGTTGSVAVTAGDSSCTWTGVSNATWLTVTSGSSGTGNGTTGYSVAANTGPQRTGTLTVGGQTFTVTQATGCTTNINPTSVSMGAAATTGSVAVTAGDSNCTWTGVSNATWLTVTSGSSGTGNGTTGYSVAANTGPQRTGTLTVAGETVTITQCAALDFTDCNLTAGTTPIRAVHITELRARINALRGGCGLSSYSFTEPNLTAGVTTAKGVHITEPRTALNEAYGACGRSAPTYADATLATGVTVIKVVHITELRAAVIALE